MKAAREALEKLRIMGYHFTLYGDTIRARYQGPGKPDPQVVRPLLETLRTHKLEVLRLLRDPTLQEEDANIAHPKRRCPCGCPAWDRGRDGQPYCWACLAAQAMFH